MGFQLLPMILYLPMMRLLIRNMGFWIAGIDYVDGVEKIDDYTAVVHYNAIYPAYLTQFGGYLMAVWPAHYCDAEQGFTQWDCGFETP